MKCSQFFWIFVSPSLLMMFTLLCIHDIKVFQKLLSVLLCKMKESQWWIDIRSNTQNHESGVQKRISEQILRLSQFYTNLPRRKTEKLLPLPRYWEHLKSSKRIEPKKSYNLFNVLNIQLYSQVTSLRSLGSEMSAGFKFIAEFKTLISDLFPQKKAY